MKYKLATLLLAVSNVAIATPSSGLVNSANNWQGVMNEKSVIELSNYYDENSLLVQFPYNTDKNMLGLESIKNMFINGPFKLNELQADINVISVDESGDIGLLLKSWDIRFDKGQFSGLAIEVLEKKDNTWIRRIDVGAGGLKIPYDFSSQDLENNNNAFNNAISSIKQAERVNIDSLASELNYNDNNIKFDNLFALEKNDIGLLTSKITSNGKTYISFSALEKADNQWVIKTSIVASSK